METDKTKNVEYKLPNRVLETVAEFIKQPTIIETDFYTTNALGNVLEKNKILWSVKYYNGINTINKEGLIKFKDSVVYLYFIRRVDEDVYKFFILLPETSTDSVMFYLNSLKKYKTI